MAVDVQIASGLPLLRGLEPRLCERLCAGAALRDYAKGEAIFGEGGKPECLFVLLGGIVELYTGGCGREPAILLLWPPEAFLPAAALTDEPYLVSARGLSASRLLLLNAAVVREEAARNPELAQRITSILAGQFRMLVRHIKDAKLRTGPQRLAAFLLRLIDEAGQHGGADLPVAKGRLASRLGLSPATLSRALRLLEGHGLTVRGSRVVLTDRQRFERFCAPDPLIDGRELSLSVTAM